MNVLTFDIEEWFHILDNGSTRTEKEWGGYASRIHASVDRILELLTAEKQSATFFCLGWICEKYPEVIKKIDQHGHEVGTHSHLHQLVYEQTPSQFRNDLKKSVEVLEDTIGKKITSYRSPGFSLTAENYWVFDILVEFGIDTDCSIFPAARAHGGIRNFAYSKPFLIRTDGGIIREFPMNFYRMLGQKVLFSGGGYFRLFPYQLIKMMFSNLDYVMTYFHPRDFDPDQPFIKDLSFIRKFKSYYGLAGSFGKLKGLITEFDFCSLRQAAEMVDWASQPVFHAQQKKWQKPDFA